MDLVDCQFWDEMKDAELEEWYAWSTYADSQLSIAVIIFLNLKIRLGRTKIL